MAHLTDASIKKLPVPAKGNKVHYEERGFGVRVTAGGVRSFVLNYVTQAGRERRYTIGSTEDWKATDAREKAKLLRREIDNGGDPLGDIEALREAPSVADLITRFIAEHVERKRPSTIRAYRQILRQHIGPYFGAHAKVADVTHDDVQRLHDKITKAGSAYAANRAVAVASKMFSLSVRWRMRPDNPAKGIERNYETKRKRYVRGDELARLTGALNNHSNQDVADVFRLLLFTGCRRGEALAARWADLDLTAGVWTKLGSTTKQKSDHVAPISAPARQLLSEIQQRQSSKQKALGEYVFPGAGGSGHVVEIKRAWRAITKAAGITGLRIHDLRHSFASQLASGGASLPLIGSLLGHSNPTTTNRYAHLFDDPQRAAVEKVGAVIAAAGKPVEEPKPLRRLR
jgi:integrase